MGDLKKVGKVIGTVGGLVVGGPLGAYFGGKALGGESVPKAAKKLGKSLVGHTEQLDTVPGDVRPLREDLIAMLMAGLPGFTNSAFGYGQASQGFQAPPASLTDPYRQLFTATRGEALAQAKEAAGNLTGSGYNNILGDAAARSLAEENATLAGLGLQYQQFQQQRNEQFLRLLLGLTTQQAQVGYKPGFLDYLFQGVGAAAPFIAK